MGGRRRHFRRGPLTLVYRTKGGIEARTASQPVPTLAGSASVHWGVSAGVRALLLPTGLRFVSRDPRRFLRRRRFDPRRSFPRGLSERRLLPDRYVHGTGRPPRLPVAAHGLPRGRDCARAKNPSTQTRGHRDAVAVDPAQRTACGRDGKLARSDHRSALPRALGSPSPGLLEGADATPSRTARRFFHLDAEAGSAGERSFPLSLAVTGMAAVTSTAGSSRNGFTNCGLSERSGFLLKCFLARNR